MEIDIFIFISLIIFNDLIKKEENNKNIINI